MGFVDCFGFLVDVGVGGSLSLFSWKTEGRGLLHSVPKWEPMTNLLSELFNKTVAS